MMRGGGGRSRTQVGAVERGVYAWGASAKRGPTVGARTILESLIVISNHQPDSLQVNELRNAILALWALSAFGTLDDGALLPAV